MTPMAHRPRNRAAQRLENDIQALCPTYTLSTIYSVQLLRNDFRVDDVRLADAKTTRVYTLAPSALGGIISIRQVNPTGPNTDTWYAYDRLGSVALTTDSDGDSNGLRWQDAYGNQLSNVSNGTWASAAASGGYGFISKSQDPDAGLVYGWQRWYDPAIGRYVSASPMAVVIEHPYTYGWGNPTAGADITGLDFYIIRSEGAMVPDVVGISGSGTAGPGFLPFDPYYAPLGTAGLVSAGLSGNLFWANDPCHGRLAPFATLGSGWGTPQAGVSAGFSIGWSSIESQTASDFAGHFTEINVFGGPYSGTYWWSGDWKGITLGGGYGYIPIGASVQGVEYYLF